MVSKKQIPLDLKSLIEKLEEAGIKYILIGGMAAIAHGAPLFSFDLDIIHERSLENIKKLKDMLISIEAYQRRPDNLMIAPDFNALKGSGHQLLSTKFGPMDILGAVEKGLGFEDLVKNVVEIEFHGFKVHVLDLKTLIELKRHSNRPEDQQRLAILEQTLELIHSKKK